MTYFNLVEKVVENYMNDPQMKPREKLSVCIRDLNFWLTFPELSDFEKGEIRREIERISRRLEETL